MATMRALVKRKPEPGIWMEQVATPAPHLCIFLCRSAETSGRWPGSMRTSGRYSRDLRRRSQVL